MGLLGRIFGTPETVEQRLERARGALADNEPDLALRILMRDEGPEASELVAQARDRIRLRDGDEPEPATDSDSGGAVATALAVCDGLAATADMVVQGLTPNFVKKRSEDKRSP